MLIQYQIDRSPLQLQDNDEEKVDLLFNLILLNCINNKHYKMENFSFQYSYDYNKLIKNIEESVDTHAIENRIKITVSKSARTPLLLI